jgi:hypothetical protein
MDGGFVKLYRKTFSHKFWTKVRVFSEFEAWIDLLQSARFDESVRIEYIGSREIRYGRGQYPASRRYLAKRWGWGEQKVRTFLTGLKKDGSVTIDDSQGMSVITLCNYDKYNSVPCNKNYNPTDNPTNNPSNDLIFSELMQLKTRLETMDATRSQPGDNPKTKKEKKEEESISNSFEKTPETDYEKFTARLQKDCPTVCKMKRQLTSEEFDKLSEKYTKVQIWEVMEQMENKSDLIKKYSWVYRTALNWLKQC